jgi:hypothetical protein
MARKATIATKVKEVETVNVLPIGRGSFSAWIVGESGLIQHSMSLKAKQALLRPPRKARTDADRAERGAKHNVLAEFKDSANRDGNPNAPTFLYMPATAIKAAVAHVALDMPGTTKAEIGRLVWVEGERIPIWGKPTLRMDVVRMADPNHTPDIRTRAFLMHWCAHVTINFTTPRLTVQAVYNLLAGAGIIRGIGDWRQEKGSGNYGRWRMCENENDPELRELIETGARSVQIAGMDQAAAANPETAELLSWWLEQERLDKVTPKTSKPLAPPRRRRGNGAEERAP